MILRTLWLRDNPSVTQSDLRRLHQSYGGEFDWNDRRLRSIERSYETLFKSTRFIYEQAKAEGGASPEWMQTELMAAAHASQQFTMDVWHAILTHNEDVGQQAMYQTMHITQINDALSFLQTADLQQNHEQAIFCRNMCEWANCQQDATNHLILEQQ